MPIRFLPTGGFGQVGGFIEILDKNGLSGDEVVYQRQRYLSPTLECFNISVSDCYTLYQRPIWVTRAGFPSGSSCDSLSPHVVEGDMAGIAITRLELTAAGLRAAAGRTKDAQASRRMLALALVLDGVDRETAARTCGMDRQTLRDWVLRYNDAGLEGLKNRRGKGRVRRLAEDQMATLASWVEAGPDPEKDGVVRWRRADLKARIAAEFGVDLHERSVGKQLAALGFRRLSVRPQHPKSDAQAQEAFKKTFPRRSRR